MEIPRRNNIAQNTRAELLIREAMNEVESLGASEDLTEVVIALQKAMNNLSDYIDSTIQ